MEYGRNIYRIPANFKDTGRIMNGMIAIRNAIDAVWLGAIGFTIAGFISPEGKNSISVYILFAGLFCILGLFGINDVPVSTFLADFFSWRSRRSPYIYNTHGRAYTVTAADVMLNTPGLSDALADMLDKVKLSMQSKRIDYIEGETFQFADDPDLEALSEAEERMSEEQEDQPRKSKKREKEQNKVQEDIPTEVLDFQSIAENIVLHDIDEV